MKRIVAIAFLVAALGGCGGDGTGPGGWGGYSVVFTGDQRMLADQIISVFENNWPEIDYAYAEDLGDGRGITAGRAGFTSATGDMLEVVERYTDIEPDNPLAVYLPRLRELAAGESGDVDGLEGLEDAWAEAAEEPVFREVQDEVVDDEYYGPAVDHADDLGMVFPLSLLNLYDACIQHGDGEDPDGLPAMIATVSTRLGGTPADGIDEREWLDAFMAVRRAVLLDPFDPDTEEAWAESVGRVDALRSIFDSANMDLAPPIVIAPFDTAFSLPYP